MKYHYTNLQRLFFAFLILMAVSKIAAAPRDFGKGYAFEQNKKMARGVNIIGYDSLW